jgi:hypothetical protein
MEKCTTFDAVVTKKEYREWMSLVKVGQVTDSVPSALMVSKDSAKSKSAGSESGVLKAFFLAFGSHWPSTPSSSRQI